MKKAWKANFVIWLFDRKLAQTAVLVKIILNYARIKIIWVTVCPNNCNFPIPVYGFHLNSMRWSQLKMVNNDQIDLFFENQIDFYTASINLDMLRLFLWTVY